ncbi:uncharacterized protein LOC129773294 [Toxorhynchites rutilus septentrionalis]|uniref:uncharacterized protein LOC129773294 n=1 Tax=Toxorhynchites rutilus septentrionalis TaxID=329112 RepID=UPI002479B930|nr:uncharacterized protein LOC129773294 [Toxorhynchites rutilus septentrionalis]
MSDAEEIFKSKKIKLSVSKFGQLIDPQTMQCHDVHKFTWETANRLTLEVITLDAAIVSLCLPDRDFAPEEVILGTGSLDTYLQYALQNLSSSVQSNPLKKRKQPFQRIWSPYVRGADLVLTNVILNESCNAMVQIKFEVTPNNVIRISYHVASDSTHRLDTTHRIALNLGGRLSGHVGTYDHVVQLNAGSYYRVVGNRLRESDERNPSEDLADLRVAHHVGMAIHRSDREGFSGVYKLSEMPSRKFDARLIHVGSGRVMELYSDFKWLRFSTMDDLTNPTDSIAPFYGKLGVNRIEQIFDMNRLIHSVVRFVEGDEDEKSVSGTINESEIRHLIDDVLLKNIEEKIQTLKEAGILTVREAREIIEDLLLMSLDRISEISIDAEPMNEEGIRMLIEDLVSDIIPRPSVYGIEGTESKLISDVPERIYSASSDVAVEADSETVDEMDVFHGFQKHCGILLQLRAVPFHRRCKRKSMFSQPNHVRKHPELVFNHSVVMKFGLCKIPSESKNKTRPSK